MTIHLVGDLMILAVTLRVFGKDTLTLLRHLAAAGVRVGVSEMSRRPHEGKEGR
ncbi:hypothetical protein OG322_37140 [Streptomyces sp. NBC_01260]|uniref:Uncharacterized protein n=1 Tax=Streptomyces laculatispora TaxID=887464 RepID=A0ABY9IF74_9ACTN|nr:MULTISPECIES: hypothetical protein [Streptomyces]MCX4774833.1 hypothetical protein [Streptomyces sp. NBC_01285]ROQ72628.1 hypothetical protein EDD95_5221 [Streptomyces sp. CEV 2-1]RPK34850.1 hypothetical protein EES39_34920 [Streptomyces sp. ADI92-24]WLQ45041.1 hypothetical protein P8A22_37245 [Streptomyces laculatispora]